MKSILKSLAFAATLLVFAATTPLIAGKGEFGGKCTFGLAQGGDFDTPCEVTWKSEDGKTYCFGNKEVKEKFLKDPKANLAKAEKFYQTMKKN